LYILKIASLVPLADMMNHSKKAKVTYMTDMSRDHPVFKLTVHEKINQSKPLYSRFLSLIHDVTSANRQSGFQ